MKVFVFPGQGTQRAGMLRQLRESYDAVKDIFDTASELENVTRRMSDAVTERMNAEKLRIERLTQKLPSLFAVARVRREQILENLWNRAVTGVGNVITSQIHKLELMDKRDKEHDKDLVEINKQIEEIKKQTAEEMIINL